MPETQSGATSLERRVSAAALATSLRLVAGRLSRRLRQQGGAGLSPSQLSALATVERHGPLHLGELAGLEGVAPPTLTRVVARLEEAGLVVRAPDPADGRSSVVTITRRGKGALAGVRGARAAFLARRIEALAEDDRALLAAALPVLDRLLEDEA